MQGHANIYACLIELRARIVALEAQQHAHVDLSHLSDAEREQVAQELAKPAAWRPLEVETTYGSEPASDEPISMATAQQILSPRMVEGTFEHGGETYRYKATPIATDQELRRAWGSVTGEDWNTALRAVYDLGRQHGSAQATCPHIATSDEGTSYCRLAEQSATPATPMTELRAARSSWSPQRRPAPRPGLVGCSRWSMSMPMVMASEQACWVVRNSRRVSPFQEFRTPEAAYAAHQARAEQAPEPVTPMDELRSASAEARPGGLVERVALALDSDCPTG